jgi:hypothetical protein
MPLRGDQRALLQLICERGQSYDDIAGLLGVSAADARSQAREALADIGGADPDAEVGLTDYLLGQADPIGRADAARYLQSDPDTLALAQRIQEGLREIAPAANQPKLPESRGKRARAAAPGPGEASPPPPRATGIERDGERNPRQSLMIAGIGALGLILLIVILAVAGVFSGGDDPSSTAAEASTSADGSTTTPDSAATSNITTVKLAPTGGSGVGGTAKFGLVNNSQLYVDLSLSGIDPTPPKGNTNLVWLMVGNQGGYPINNPADSPITPDQNGNYSGRIAVPTPVAVTIGNQATAVKVSSSPITDVADAAKQASKSKAPILPFIGTELASGDIPLANDASSSSGSQGATTTPGG